MKAMILPLSPHGPLITWMAEGQHQVTGAAPDHDGQSHSARAEPKRRHTQRFGASLIVLSEDTVAVAPSPHRQP